MEQLGYNPVSDELFVLQTVVVEAKEHFELDSGRRQVMVLLNAAYCDPTNTRRPVDGTGFPCADETADEMRDAGTRILALFGPVAANQHCWPKTRPLDVALAIDRSSRMEGEKLGAAVEAVRAFLDAARLSWSLLPFLVPPVRSCLIAHYSCPYTRAHVDLRPCGASARSCASR